MPLWGELDRAARDAAVDLFCSGVPEAEVLRRFGVTNPSAGRKLRRYRAIREGRKGGATDQPAKWLPDSELDKLILRALRKQPLAITDLCDVVNAAPKAIRAAIERLQKGGIPVCMQEQQVSVPETPPPIARVLPALWRQAAGRVATLHVSDTHFGSYAAQKSALRLLVKIAVEEYGVKAAFHSGDVCAGNRVYRGQEHELYALGFESQIDDTANSLPRYDGLTWYAIGGNHDASYYTQNRVDFMRQLAKVRPDVVNCGWDAADVPLTESCDLRMWHPSGGVPYALSYRGQRYAAQIAQEELLALVMEHPAPRVRLLQIGHLHVMMGPTPFGALRFFQAGCFEGATNYLRRKGLTPQVGGYIMEHDITESGTIRSLAFRDYIFDQVADDWRSYPRPDPALSYGVDVVYRLSEMDVAPDYCVAR